ERHRGPQRDNDERERNPSPIEFPTLPGSPAPAAATTAGKTASAAAATPAACRRLRDRRAQRAREPLEVAGEDRRVEGARALVPARDRRAGVDAFEGLRPAVDAAEDDGVREVLGEDFRLFRKRLPVFLRPGHVE